MNLQIREFNNFFKNLLIVQTSFKHQLIYNWTVCNKKIN